MGELQAENTYILTDMQNTIEKHKNPGEATLLWQLYKQRASNTRKQRGEIAEMLENVLKIIL